MTRYKVTFRATVERTIEVPDGRDWSQAHQFAEQTLGWHEIANSAAAKVTIESRPIRFDREVP